MEDKLPVALCPGRRHRIKLRSALRSCLVVRFLLRLPCPSPAAAVPAAAVQGRWGVLMSDSELSGVWNSIAPYRAFGRWALLVVPALGNMPVAVRANKQT